MLQRMDVSRCCCATGGDWIEWAINIENGIGWEVGGGGGVSALPDPMEIETPFEYPGLPDYEDRGPISRGDTFFGGARSVWGYAWVANIPASVTAARITWQTTAPEPTMSSFSPPGAELYYALEWTHPGYPQAVYRADLSPKVSIAWSYSHSATVQLDVTSIVQAAIADSSFVANQAVAFILFPDLSYTDWHSTLLGGDPVPQTNGFLVNPANPGQWTTFELMT